MLDIFEDYEKIQSQIPLIFEKLKKCYKEVDLNEFGGCAVLSARNDDTNMHLLIQSGLHGIEGFIGFAMINYFVERFLGENKLKYDKVRNKKEKVSENFKFERNFDLSLIINANSFGVKNKRRVNENNVDLNRNFLLSEKDFENGKEKAFLDQYYLIDKVINPKKKVKNFYFSYIETFFRILNLVLKIKASKFKAVLLSGQKYNPCGAYYMGENYQTQTLNLMKIHEDLFKLKGVQNTIFIDLHTGYGKAYNMSIVNSSFMKENDLTEKIKGFYDNVVKSNTDSFYVMNGDLIDFIYQKYPEIKYATAFEFGTFGDSILAGLKSIIALVLENQYFSYNLNGKKDDSLNKDVNSNRAGAKIIQFYEKAYFPKSKKWLNKAQQDFERAICGIIHSL